MSRTLKVSSSGVAKTIKRYDETGSEDRYRKGRAGVTSAAVTSLNKCFTEFKYQTHLNINSSEKTA
jgi:transposase